MLARLRRHLSYANVASTAALFIVLGGVGYAVIPSPDGKIHGCYNKTNGNLRVVESANDCRKHETAIAWNQRGPVGDTGATGPPGPPGEGPATSSHEQAGEVSTASDTYIDLGGPEVSITVPPTGLVAATIRYDHRADHGESDNYLVNPSTCPLEGWAWSFDFSYINGDHLSTPASASCTPGSSARAPSAVQEVQVVHDPATAGDGTTVTISASLSEPDGSQVSPTTEIVMHLPLGMAHDVHGFPECALSELEARGPDACPEGSRVGSGTARFSARPVVADPINANITAFNGEDGKVLLYVFPDLGPTFVIVGTPSDSPNGPVLTFAVPPVKTLPSAPDASLTQLDLALGATTESVAGGCVGVLIDGAARFDPDPSGCASATTYARRLNDWLVFETTPGPHTFSLRYRCQSPARTCTAGDRAFFKNRKLWITPIG